MRAFTRLYRESYPMVYSYVRRRMGGDAAAEDVVAEAYLLAARSFARFDPARSKFSTWVTHIALNCMASHYRKERVSVPLEELPESMASETEIFDHLGDRELAERLLGVLDEGNRQVVLLKYRDGLRNVEIAEQLGMNPSTVSTMLARSLARMRSCYEAGL